MNNLLDAFWRAVAYCLHPRVILLSLLPLVIAGGATAVLGWFFWESAVDAVQGALQGWSLSAAFLQWLQAMGGERLRSMLPLIILVALSVPVVVVLSLLLVALLMTPALTLLVAARRFPQLQRKRGAGILASIGWSLGHTVVALVLLAASVPLWLIPPLVMLIPPLIWGWLTYRVMTFDVLADFADRSERRRILREHRWPLLGIGLVTGYLGAAPALVWSLGAMVLPLAPVLIPATVWLYTLVFAFSSLWFTHFTLAALQRLRDQSAATAAPPAAPAGLAATPPAPAADVDLPLLPPTP